MKGSNNGIKMLCASAHACTDMHISVYTHVSVNVLYQVTIARFALNAIDS